MDKMQQIKVEFNGVTKEDLALLFGTPNPGFGFKKKLAEGIEVENRTAPTMGVEPITIITILIKLGIGITSGVASKYIHEWLKGKFPKLNANDQSYKVDRDELKKMIDEIREEENKKPGEDENANEKK